MNSVDGERRKVMRDPVPIVIAACSRAQSLARLLDSVGAAVYSRADIPLIVSVDVPKGASCADPDVLRAAEDFRWTHGEKAVVVREEHLGLRRHVLLCGDYALTHGAAVVLEDDLFVSAYFYEFAQQALEFSRGREKIGGISLYCHRFNMIAAEPFEPIDDGSDNWYLQFASSWGAAWAAEQWRGFREWLDREPAIGSREEVPAYVRGWPESSWLKYAVAYLVERDRFFLYPRRSLTTNFGEAGTHVGRRNTDYQVPLQNGPAAYRFSDPGESGAVYDAFFESRNLRDRLAEEGIDTEIDLYGTKPPDYGTARYFLTRRALPYGIARRYGREMRPHEENVLRGIGGEDFFLYDRKTPGKRPKTDKVRAARYHLRGIDRRHYAAVVASFARRSLDGIRRRLVRPGRRRRKGGRR